MACLSGTAILRDAAAIAGSSSPFAGEQQADKGHQMTTLLPKAPVDLALAPVAAHIDDNLSRIRDISPSAIDVDLQLQLNTPPRRDDTDERCQRIRAVALRDVDLHGWDAAISHDWTRLRLSGGSVSIELGLSAAIRDYIAGPASRNPVKA
jgi:hypothetical protein